MGVKDSIGKAWKTVSRRLGEEVVYMRNGKQVNITAVREAKTYTVQTEEGVYISANIIDWIFTLTDIKSLGDSPLHGDQIKDSVGRVYEALGDQGIGAFDHVDTQAQLVSAHMRQVA